MINNVEGSGSEGSSEQQIAKGTRDTCGGGGKGRKAKGIVDREIFILGGFLRRSMFLRLKSLFR